MWKRGLFRTLWDTINGISWEEQATDKELVKAFRRLPEISMNDFYYAEAKTQEIFDEIKARLKESPDGHPRLKPFMEAHATLPEHKKDDFQAYTLIDAVDALLKEASSRGSNVSTPQLTVEP